MKNLKNYILHLDNWIPKNILDKTLKELSKEKTWKQHSFVNPRTFELYNENGNKELDICYGNNLTYLKQLHELTQNALEKYIVIKKIGEKHFNSWQGFSQIRFNLFLKTIKPEKYIINHHKPNTKVAILFTNNTNGGIEIDNTFIKSTENQLVSFDSNIEYNIVTSTDNKIFTYAIINYD